MRTWFAAMAIAFGTLAAAPDTALAQGALVHGSVAAAVSDDTTSPAFGGGVTWRFNRAFGLGVELSHYRSLVSDFAHIYCCFTEDEDTRATVFTTNFRLEVPTTSTRVIPFVVGGGGVAAVTQSYEVIYARLDTMPGLTRLGPNLVPGTILPGPSPIKSTSTSMALTLGGGASFLVTDRFAIDADLRVLHLMRDDSRNIGRYGVGVSYRF